MHRGMYYANNFLLAEALSEVLYVEKLNGVGFSEMEKGKDCLLISLVYKIEFKQ